MKQRPLNKKAKGTKEAIGKYIEKPRLSLIPAEALYEMAIAFGFGELKYHSHNFKKGIPVSFSLDAANRHMLKFNNGENYDEESKAHHLGAAMTNLAMAIWTSLNKPELDDRYADSKRQVRYSRSTRPKRS